MDHRRNRVTDHRRPSGCLLGMVILVSDEFACGEVGSTEQHSVDVLMAPHHALRETGRTAGVEQIDIVGAARPEVALGRSLGDRLVELDATVVFIGLCRHVAAIVDHQHRLDIRNLGQHVGDPFGVLAFVHQRDHVGVIEQVAQLRFDVAVVDVHQDRAGLHNAQHRDHDLDPVAAVKSDLVVLLHAVGDEIVREAVRLFLQPGIGDLFVPADQGDTVRHGVDGVLGKIGNIQGHGLKLEPVTVLHKCSGQEGGHR